MPKIMIHGNDARRALAHGVQKLSVEQESMLTRLRDMTRGYGRGS